jgi:phosphatidylglycerophosphate synthase
MTDHTRIIDSLTGPVERAALQFFAARMPAWISPDVLTVTGVLGAALTGVGYCLTNLHPGFLWLASLGLAVNWFGDSLDGTLARYRLIERPRYGFFVDHTADTVSLVLIMLGFGLSPFVEFEVVLMICIGYLLLILVVSFRTFLEGVFQITFGKLGPTEARCVLVLVNTGIFFGGNPIVRLPFVTTTLIDLVSVCIAAWLFAAFGVASVRQTRRLAKDSD